MKQFHNKWAKAHMSKSVRMINAFWEGIIHGSSRLLSGPASWLVGIQSYTKLTLTLNRNLVGAST